MSKIIQTILKNYQVLFKNKFALIILLLGPIVLTFLIGFFYFNSNSFSISLGVHSPDDSEFNQFILSELKSSDFSILKYKNTLECENAIKSGLIHACIFLPKNFKISDNSENAITLKLDASRGDIVAVTQNLINDQLTEITKQIQIVNTQKLISIINSSEQIINHNNQKYNTITEINKNLKTTNTNIKKQNAKLSNLFNKKSLGLEDLSKTYIGLNNTIKTITTNILSNLNKTENKISLAIEDLEKLNNSKTNKIKGTIKDIRTYKLSIDNDVNKIKNSYYLNKLKSIIKTVDTKIKANSNSAEDLSLEINQYIDKNSLELDNTSTVLSQLSQNGIKHNDKIAQLDSKNPQTLMNPVSIKIKNIVANSSVHLVSMFPSLIVGLIFIISLIMSSMFILTERKNKANFRNFMSKNSAFNFTLGNFLSLFSIVFIQASLIIALYYFWFLKNYSNDILYFLILIAPVVAVFVLLGMIIGYLTRNESTNVIISFLVILGFLSFSGKLIPLETLSQSVISITLNNPLLLAEGIIRKYLLFDIKITEFSKEFTLLGIYILISFIINIILESFSKKRFLHGIFSEIFLSIRNYFSLKQNSYSIPNLNKEITVPAEPILQEETPEEINKEYKVKDDSHNEIKNEIKSEIKSEIENEMKNEIIQNQSTL